MNRYVYINFVTGETKEIYANNRASAEALLVWFYPLERLFMKLAYVD